MYFCIYMIHMNMETNKFHGIFKLTCVNVFIAHIQHILKSSRNHMYTSFKINIKYLFLFVFNSCLLSPTFFFNWLIKGMTTIDTTFYPSHVDHLTPYFDTLSQVPNQQLTFHFAGSIMVIAFNQCRFLCSLSHCPLPLSLFSTLTLLSKNDGDFGISLVPLSFAQISFRNLYFIFIIFLIT